MNLRPAPRSLRERDTPLRVAEQGRDRSDKVAVGFRDHHLDTVTESEAFERNRRGDDSLPVRDCLEDLHTHPAAKPDRHCDDGGSV